MHRDVRPANILVEEDGGRVILMDFGIAALLESGAQMSSRLTATGMRLGDPFHMSPEQLRGEPVTAQSDVYGLGILGYELLTGAPPRPSGSVALDLLPAGSDPLLVQVIGRCLAPVPEHRPRAMEVAEALMRTAPARESGEAGVAESLTELQRFLKEVRRRKVGRMALAYVVAAFVFLQAVDLLVPVLAVADPEGWYRVIAALTLLGFPVALVLSWLFDVTAEGMRRARAVEGAKGGTRRLVLPIVALSLSVFAALGAWLMFYRVP